MVICSCPLSSNTHAAPALSSPQTRCEGSCDSQNSLPRLGPHSLLPEQTLLETHTAQIGMANTRTEARADLGCAFTLYRARHFHA